VHRTTNGGQSWEVISPDLSTNDKSRQQFSGGLTGDNIGVEYAFVVMAIAESPKEKGVIWAGTNDGQVQVTRDNGKTWTNVTKNIANLPPMGTVGNIEASRYDAGTAYISVDLHQVNNRDPFIYKTTDYGKTWKAITNGIPRSMLSYAHCVREDPVRKGLLYVGTENALYVSFDDGDNWQALQAGLPPAPVYWITFAEQMNDMVIATYGRGFWVLDDLTPLQQMNAQTMSADAHLFQPRPAYRFREVTNNYTTPNDPTVGVDPPYGAAINFSLRNAGNVTLTIEDEKGQVVRTLKTAGRAGLNRVMWDLRQEQTKEVQLRTKPVGVEEFRMPDEGWRSGGQRLAVLMGPGTYTVKLSAGGREQAQKLVVRKDPNSGGSEAELTEQMKTLSEIRTDVESAADVINQAELVRYQLQQLPKLAGDADIAQVAASIEQKFTDLEMSLQELRATGRGQDNVRWGAKLYSKLTYLANGLMSNDYRPTAQQLEVQKLQQQQLRELQGKLNNLLTTDIAMFNEKLRARNLSTIMVAPAKRTSEQR